MSTPRNGKSEIWQRRDDLRVSREWVAAHLGMSMKTLERKEKGTAPLSDDERDRILAFYDRMREATKARETV